MRKQLACVDVRLTSKGIRIMAGVASLASAVGSCHRSASPPERVTVVQTRRDTAATIPTIKDPRLEDTSLVTVTSAQARTFELKSAARRDSLTAVLRRERRLWNTRRPQNYRYLLRVECFCPGTRGWLVMEVRGSELRAYDRAGKTAPVTDWNTLSIDGLFDMMERSVRRDNVVRIGFDPRWHFPGYFYSVTPPGPDTWAIIEARGLRPL